jgi:hypothetical protein
MKQGKTALGVPRVTGLFLSHVTSNRSSPTAKRDMSFGERQIDKPSRGLSIGAGYPIVQAYLRQVHVVESVQQLLADPSNQLKIDVCAEAMVRWWRSLSACVLIPAIKSIHRMVYFPMILARVTQYQQWQEFSDYSEACIAAEESGVVIGHISGELHSLFLALHCLIMSISSFAGIYRRSDSKGYSERAR